MVIQLIAQHPEILLRILRSTPTWVWGLLAALLALGISQLRDRSASLVRVSMLPVAMTLFSGWGTLAAFGRSPLLEAAIGVWVGGAMLLFLVVAPGHIGASYDPARRTYALPGSVGPLALILGIFLVKYVVGVDLAMAPELMRDPQYALSVAALYGAFSGMFVGRAARLWRLALAARPPFIA